LLRLPHLDPFLDRQMQTEICECVLHQTQPFEYWAVLNGIKDNVVIRPTRNRQFKSGCRDLSFIKAHRAK
jgi:hypothetical protein